MSACDPKAFCDFCILSLIQVQVSSLYSFDGLLSFLMVVFCNPGCKEEAFVETKKKTSVFQRSSHVASKQKSIHLHCIGVMVEVSEVFRPLRSLFNFSGQSRHYIAGVDFKHLSSLGFVVVVTPFISPDNILITNFIPEHK